MSEGSPRSEGLQSFTEVSVKRKTTKQKTIVKIEDAQTEAFVISPDDFENLGFLDIP